MRSFLRWLGRAVYGTFVPLQGPLEGAESYLETLWRDAPKRVALIHTLVAFMVMWLPPLVIVKFKPLCFLSHGDRERFQQKMLHSKYYVIRMLALAVRGHALVSTFRDEKVYREFFPQKRSVPQ